MTRLPQLDPGESPRPQSTLLHRCFGYHPHYQYYPTERRTYIGGTVVKQAVDRCGVVIAVHLVARKEMLRDSARKVLRLQHGESEREADSSRLY
jgi:hypothetical protein